MITSQIAHNSWLLRVLLLEYVTSPLVYLRVPSYVGPLLFILTFDGIFRLPLSPESNLSGYANDVTYSRCISGPIDEPAVNNDLVMICDWLSSKGFRLNTNKVKDIIVSRKKKPPSMHLELQGELLEFVDNFRLLGVTITSDLS